MRDVVTGDPTGVERTHGQLSTGLTDRLGRDDADGLAHVHQLAGGERAAVAGRAGAERRLTGQHRTHPNLGHAAGDQLVDQDVTEVRATGRHHGAVDFDILGQHPGVHARLRVAVLDQPAVGRGRCDRQLDAPLGATVLFADDHVLRHVHQTTGQVTRVGGT